MPKSAQREAAPVQELWAEQEYEPTPAGRAFMPANRDTVLGQMLVIYDYYAYTINGVRACMHSANLDGVEYDTDVVQQQVDIARNAEQYTGLLLARGFLARATP